MSTVVRVFCDRYAAINSFALVYSYLTLVVYVEYLRTFLQETRVSI